MNAKIEKKKRQDAAAKKYKFDGKKVKEDDHALYEDQTRIGDIVFCNMILRLISILIILTICCYFSAMLFRFVI